MQHSLEFTVTVCCECGIPFAIPERFNASLRESHDSFYCPNGHGQSYQTKTEADKFRGIVGQHSETIKFLRKRNREFERSHSALRGQVTKLRNKLKK